MNSGSSESSGWPISWRLRFSQVNSGQGASRDQKVCENAAGKFLKAVMPNCCNCRKYLYLSCLLLPLFAPLCSSDITIGSRKVLQMVVLRVNKMDSVVAWLLLWLRASF